MMIQVIYFLVAMMSSTTVCDSSVDELTWSCTESSELDGVDMANIPTNSFLPDGTYIQDERLHNSVPLVDGERHIVVVTCSYNNAAYYQWNLDSIFSQGYKNFHLIYIDDCSSDKTCELVKKYIVEHNCADRVILLHNESRRRALANLYYAIHTCKPTDIVAILDGDDRFFHANVLKRINSAYANSNTWLTYGQFVEYPSGRMGFCSAYPQHIVSGMLFRYHPDTPSHLRTFYAGLFHKIRKEDLMFQGDFFSTTYDLAIMFPMIEMARRHFIFIPEVLVEYNGANPINDHKCGGKSLQRKYDLIIRARTCYADIESPF